MQESTQRKTLLAALLVFGIIIFTAGINWGLPTSAVNQYLFGPDSSARTDSTQAYQLSGAGINHLAGGWDEDPGRGADVSEHPIAKPRQPETLIENQPHLSADQIAATGDPKMKSLLATENTDWKKFSDIGKSPNHSDQDFTAAGEKYNDQHNAVRQYVNQYTADHIPGFTDAARHDDAMRPRILRRYRLYSFQPDEMLTFRALAQMHPGQGQLDPRMYQYGGLWIYPVGAIIKVASFFGFVTVSNEAGYYLEHPEEFGRFYVLARAYTAAWGLIAMLAIFALVRKITGSLAAATVAAVCFLCMPVVIDLAHEAKPHLPGLALILLAVLAASNYIVSGKTKWMILAALACGAAAGMVLSAATAILLIPLMTLLRHDHPGRALSVVISGVVIATGTYFATNPYVAMHLLHWTDPNPLRSNLTNTQAMYSLSPDVANAARLIAAGASWPLALAGSIAAISLALARKSTRSGMPTMLAALGFLVLIEFTMYAGDKPGEYARFALLLDVVLMLAAVVGIWQWQSSPRIRLRMGLILIFATFTYSISYELGFLRDSTPNNSRMELARLLQQTIASFTGPTPPIIEVYADPAPYSMPPIDLSRCKIVLLPPLARSFWSATVGVIRPDDSVSIFDPASTPISWANKSFTIAGLNIGNRK